jgi:hypothetical protein
MESAPREARSEAAQVGARICNAPVAVQHPCSAKDATLEWRRVAFTFHADPRLGRTLRQAVRRPGRALNTLAWARVCGTQDRWKTLSLDESLTKP